jgi:hypothetical protein
LDEHNCSKAAKIETTEVTYCSSTDKGLFCEVEIHSLSDAQEISLVKEVPFFHQGLLLQLDLGLERPVVVPGLAQLAEARDCQTAGHTAHCPAGLLFKPDACLEYILANKIDKLSASCRFQTKPLNDIPYILQFGVGKTLVAQRSAKPVSISLESSPITEDPVLIYHKTPVTIHYGSDVIVIPGDDGREKNQVILFKYNETTLDSIVVASDFATSWDQDLLPDDIKDVLTIVTLIIELVMLLPCCFILSKYKCCTENRGGSVRPSTTHRISYRNRSDLGPASASIRLDAGSHPPTETDCRVDTERHNHPRVIHAEKMISQAHYAYTKVHRAKDQA